MSKYNIPLYSKINVNCEYHLPYSFCFAHEKLKENKQKAKIDTTIDCIIDDIGEPDEHGHIGADARSKADAPEIDSTVYLRDAGHLSEGDIVKVKIEDADEGDLFGVPV